jgi:cytochrome b subunit of formate dehydrogenase
VFVTFLKDNWPSKEDITWLLKGGGLLSGQEVASHRFNAGEKVLFWLGVLGLGAIVVASGLVLDKLIPGLIYERGTMQIANMIHGVCHGSHDGHVHGAHLHGHHWHARRITVPCAKAMSMKLGPKNTTNFGTTTSKRARSLHKDLLKQLPKVVRGFHIGICLKFEDYKP